MNFGQYGRHLEWTHASYGDTLVQDVGTNGKLLDLLRYSCRYTPLLYRLLSFGVDDKLAKASYVLAP